MADSDKSLTPYRDAHREESVVRSSTWKNVWHCLRMPVLMYDDSCVHS